MIGEPYARRERFGKWASGHDTRARQNCRTMLPRPAPFSRARGAEELQGDSDLDTSVCAARPADPPTGYPLIRILLTLAAIYAMAGHAALAQRTVPATDLLNPPATEWLTYGRTYDNQRFSPLTQITAQNVAQLVPVAVYQMNVAPAGSRRRRSSPAVCCT